MKVLKEIIQIKNSAVGLGFFDGVHLGHQELIKNLVNYAKENNLKSILVTFEKSPAECFKNNVEYITNNTEKERIISELGIDYMFELDFNKELMQQTREEYLGNIIHKNFEPKAIVTGFNHTFGRDKKGTPEYLNENKKRLNYTYIKTDAVKMGNETISSTIIKEHLKLGEIKKANALLGHNFKISGIVIKGNQIGRTIGFPTANINYPEKIVQIPFGVYCCEVLLDKECFKGILNYGLKPTIDKKTETPIAEVHIIRFNRDIYGEEIDICVLDKIRDEKKFNSLEELKTQIKKDLEEC